MPGAEVITLVHPALLRGWNDAQPMVALGHLDLTVPKQDFDAFEKFCKDNHFEFSMDLIHRFADNIRSEGLLSIVQKYYQQIVLPERAPQTHTPETHTPERAAAPEMYTFPGFDVPGLEPVRMDDAVAASQFAQRYGLAIDANLCRQYVGAIKQHGLLEVVKYHVGQLQKAKAKNFHLQAPQADSHTTEAAPKMYTFPGVGVPGLEVSMDDAQNAFKFAQLHNFNIDANLCRNYADSIKQHGFLVVVAHEVERLSNSGFLEGIMKAAGAHERRGAHPSSSQSSYQSQSRPADASGSVSERMAGMGFHGRHEPTASHDRFDHGSHGRAATGRPFYGAEPPAYGSSSFSGRTGAEAQPHFGGRSRLFDPERKGLFNSGRPGLFDDSRRSKLFDKKY